MNSIDEFIEAAGEEDIVNVDIEGDEPAKVRVYVE
jgi:predicted lipoprotein